MGDFGDIQLPVPEAGTDGDVLKASTWATGVKERHIVVSLRETLPEAVLAE